MKKQTGQTLIEAIIALATILLIITAISIVIVNSLHNSQFIKNQNEANKYAQEGMEFIRNLQRNDLATFVSLSPNQTNQVSMYCIDNVNNALTQENCDGTTVNTGESHIRTIVLSSAGGCAEGTEINVMVTVSWLSTKCPVDNRFCHKSQLVSCMPYVTSKSNL